MADDDDTPIGDEDNDSRLPAPNKYLQDEADKHQAEADAAAVVAADVLTNASYDEFFAPYQPAVRESFAYHYVLRRQTWVNDGEREARRPGRHLNLHEKEAYRTLWAIQQKKVFDLQCRWRAEEVRDVPGVVITNDFQTLGFDIEHCTAVPPISPDEFALFLAWVKQADYAANFDDMFDSRFDWQQFRLVRETLAPDAPPIAGRAVPTRKAVPDWYRFHNEHTGHGQLLYLPDVRGAKEERYWDAWRAGEDEKKAIAEAAGTAPPPDARPSYLPSEELRVLAQEFARRFEPSRLNRWREVSELLHPPVTDEDRKFTTIVARMQMMTEPVPIAAGSDWRTATRDAFLAYCHRKLVECLPLVYEEYQQRQDWGITQPNRLEDNFALKHDIAGFYRGWLLDGRARLGEPGDFNF
jgi:hypothetical protein